MKKNILIFIGLVPLIAFSQKAQPDFQTSETRAIISYLASDELKGRAIFTPEIDKAANFIADHFKKVGLNPFNGDTDYLQTFSMYSAKFKGLSANINNENIIPDRVIVVTTAPELAIDETADYDIVRIKSGADFFREAYTHAQGDGNKIVLVDSSFTDSFKRLTFLKRSFFNNGGSTIFILGTPVLKKFTIKASHEINENRLANVVGVLPGKSRPDEYMIFSAHYDHVGIGKPLNGDSIYNGANDDASGTTAVMMLSDYFSKQNDNERTILFVAFTAEETGGFGSRYFSLQIKPEKVVAMLNIEMIGTDSKWGKNSAYITGFDKSSLGAILQENLVGSGFNFYSDPYPEMQLFYRSDNATLARLGVPAHTVSTSKMDNEPFYHKPGDELKTLDLDNMTEIIRSIAISATDIISGKNTPTRVKAEELNR